MLNFMLIYILVKMNDVSQFFDVEGTSMSREGFQKVISKAGYAIASDPILMDNAFALFGIST